MGLMAGKGVCVSLRCGTAASSDLVMRPAVSRAHLAALFSHYMTPATSSHHAVRDTTTTTAAAAADDDDVDPPVHRHSSEAADAAAGASIDRPMLRTPAQRRLAAPNAVLRPLTPTHPSLSRSLSNSTLADSVTYRRPDGKASYLYYYCVLANKVFLQCELFQNVSEC